MRMLLTLCLLALVPVATGGQDKKNDDEPIKIAKINRKDAVSYDKEVEPIFKKNCFACHSGKEKKSRFDISSYETLVKGGKRGSPIVPGKSQDSLLIKMCSRNMDPFMPPPEEQPPLSSQELGIIALWIDQGAKAPTSTTTVVPKINIGVPPANVTPVRAVVVSPDKAFIVAGRGNQLLVWEGAKGEFLRTLKDPKLVGPDGKSVDAAHLSLVESLAISPDGKLLASGSFQEVILWDIKAGKIEKRLTGFAHNVVAVAFSADGELLATGGGIPATDGEVKVFDVETGNLVTDVKNGHSDTVYGVSFCPVTRGGGWWSAGKSQIKLAACGADKFVKVFEIPSGKFLKAFEGHTHHVLDVGWKFDGKLLASAGADNAIKIWNYETGEQVKPIVNAHTKQLTRLQYIGKTGQFATCGGDGVVKFWNIDAGTAARNFPAGNDFYYGLGVSADGSLVAAGGEEGIVRIYNGTNGQLIRALPLPGAAPEKK
jgi:WD40 repeat protein